MFYYTMLYSVVSIGHTNVFEFVDADSGGIQVRQIK